MTNSKPEPTPRDIRRWRRYLAAERAEAAVYRDLAAKRSGEEREILLALADAEGRHEEHWLALLGDRAPASLKGDVRTRALGFLARRFGGVFVLALAQRAESRSPYEGDNDATARMAADERIHEEVIRGLAGRGRLRLSGSFRAAVFGANDGLVSNLALILGVSGAGVGGPTILLTGVAGLLAGALSMAAGEYVSVRSQRELLAASIPNPEAAAAVPALDVDVNELALVYRARGESEAAARAHADRILRGGQTVTASVPAQHEAVGSATSAAISSFLFFASGALLPVIPYLFGMDGVAAVALAAALVGVALLLTGATVGVLSGASPLRRALRQLAIGYGAAAVTYLIGALFGATVL
ncbi:VIT1/CCC1 family protein [Lysobacter korlensis]|uniref:VIT1/CCC1 family protein n=1 Tax=Lysobacter korlensis TaxID=553636 RepID=A0ABV6RN83_9GAMM